MSAVPVRSDPNDFVPMTLLVPTPDDKRFWFGLKTVFLAKGPFKTIDNLGVSIIAGITYGPVVGVPFEGESYSVKEIQELMAEKFHMPKLRILHLLAGTVGDVHNTDPILYAGFDTKMDAEAETDNKPPMHISV